MAAEYSITEDGTTEVGHAGEQEVGTIVLQFVSDGTFDGSIEIRGKARRAPTSEYVPILYKRRNLAGTVSDDTAVSAAITDSALIEINAAGLDIALETTSTTTGQMDVYPSSLVG